MKYLVCALCLLAAPAAASDACHDLWYTRNALIDRAGYCFGSTLGQAIFYNGDCTGKSVTLPPQTEQTVAAIRHLEARIGCRVNTNQTFLNLDDLHLRRQLWDLPVLDELQSACLGWIGSAVGLRAGHRRDAPVIGQIRSGDHVKYGHPPVGSWTYVTTSGPDWRVVSGGWLDMSAVQENCRDIAG